MATTAPDPRRVAYHAMRIAQDDLQRMTAPISRGRYTDAHRDAAWANLKQACRDYRLAAGERK